jgi:hypothetical protein
VETNEVMEGDHNLVEVGVSFGCPGTSDFEERRGLADDGENGMPESRGSAESVSLNLSHKLFDNIGSLTKSFEILDAQSGCLSLRTWGRRAPNLSLSESDFSHLLLLCEESE